VEDVAPDLEPSVEVPPTAEEAPPVEAVAAEPEITPDEQIVAADPTTEPAALEEGHIPTQKPEELEQTAFNDLVQRIQNLTNELGVESDQLTDSIEVLVQSTVDNFGLEAGRFVAAEARKFKEFKVKQAAEEVAEKPEKVKPVTVQKPKAKKKTAAPSKTKVAGAPSSEAVGFPLQDDIKTESEGSREQNVRLERPSGEASAVNAPEVIDALAEAVQAFGSMAPIRIGRFGQRALGVFKVRPEVIRVKEANDISTSAHEVAHAIENAVFGWEHQGPWKRPIIQKQMQDELLKMGKTRKNFYLFHGYPLKS